MEEKQTKKGCTHKKDQINKSTRQTELWIKYIEFLQEFLQKRVKIEAE